jgi:hypothetical protein
MNSYYNSDSSRNPVSSSGKQLFDEAINIKLTEEGEAIARVKLPANLGLSRSLQLILLQENEESVLVALARNTSLLEEVQEKLVQIGTLAVQQSLAANRNLSELLMMTLADSDSKDVRADLASNTSLPESLQTRLIADSSISVRINIAKNPALKIALQKHMSRVDNNVDVRLALLDNPSLDELVRVRVVSSFTRSDLTSAESDLHSAEMKSTQLYSERKEASQKCINSYGVLFPSSEEKIEKLTREVDRIQYQIFSVDKEIDTLKIKYRKIYKCLYPGANPRPY